MTKEEYFLLTPEERKRLGTKERIEGPPERRKIKLTKIEVTDLIRAAAQQDLLRQDPEMKRLLELPWDQFYTEAERLPGLAEHTGETPED